MCVALMPGRSGRFGVRTVPEFARRGDTVCASSTVLARHAVPGAAFPQRTAPVAPGRVPESSTLALNVSRGVSLTVTGCAKGNAKPAESQAVAAVGYLKDCVVVISIATTVTNSSANEVKVMSSSPIGSESFGGPVFAHRVPLASTSREGSALARGAPCLMPVCAVELLKEQMCRTAPTVEPRSGTTNGSVPSVGRQRLAP